MLSSSNHAHEIGDTLTESAIAGTSSHMGRNKLWDVRINVTMTEAMKLRIEAAAKAAGEPALDLIRKAIESELKRRERTSAKPNP